MRVAALRTNIQKIYLQDVENSSQRDFSSEPKGQSRYFVHPTDAALQAVLNTYALATLVGGNAGPYDTTGGNNTKLNIKTTGSTFKQVTVRSGASVTAAQIVQDLNAGFKSAGIAATARVAGTAVAIDTTTGGASIALQLSASSPSTATLQTVLGLSVTAVPGATLSALKAAVYPTVDTANVASATILGISASLANLTTAAKASLVAAVQDIVAPRLVETGPVLRSFSYGVLSKLRDPGFQPGAPRVKLPAAAAVYCLADDGSTPFTL